MPKKRFVLPALVIALTAGTLIAPTPASAANTGPGTVTVQLTNLDATAVSFSGMLVELSGTNGSSAYDSVRVAPASGLVSFATAPAGVSLKVATIPGKPYIATTKTGVRVSSGHTKAETMPVPVGATISGKVTANGFGVGSALVVALDSHGAVVKSTTAGNDGTYQLGPFSTGSYRIQLNSRKNGTGGSAVEDESWSYWKGTTNWTKAKAVKVAQETSHAPATAAQNVNGVVSAAPILKATSVLAGNHADAQVTVESSHAADSFRTDLGDGSGFSQYLNPGKYRIAIQGTFDPIVGAALEYWYRGDNTGPTLSESKATWITVKSTDTIIRIHFEDQPAAY